MNPFERLSEREQEVAGLLLQGKSNKQIAQALNVTTRTIEYHLSSIYKKLGVASRAEALLLLAENRLRESTGAAENAEFREPTVEKGREPAENEGNPIPQTRRFPMNKTLLTLFALGGALILGLFVFILVYNFSVPQNELSNQDFTQAVTAISMADAPVSFAPTATMAASLSPRQQNVAEARRLAEEYDQAVQTEMQKGNFENSQDPKTGKQRVLFVGELQEKILKLYDEMSHKLVDLDKQYLALYIAEMQPTPYPTQTSEQENEAYYQSLVKDYQVLLDQLVKDGPTVRVFDPHDGIYYNRLVGDAYARSEVMMSAMETLHQAPDMARVDQSADADLIRKELGQPDMQLTFVEVGSQANAPWISTSIYLDQAQNKYYVAVGKNVLAAIEPWSSPSVPAIEVKPIEEVRQIAEKFVREHSQNYDKYQNQLAFEQGGKGDIYFFTWRFKDKDWSATDWKMMPPFLQIGMSADGKLLTLIDTLDLYQE